MTKELAASGFSTFNSSMSINLADFIAPVPDFPKPGILFRDISPLLAAPEAFKAAVRGMAELVKRSGASMIVAIESRGFIFGAPVALEVGLPMVLVRKPGKLPGEREQVSYGLEYGKDSLEVKRGMIPAGTKIAIIDDVLATGGTAVATEDLVTRVGGEVVSFVFLLEISGLPGRERLGGERVSSLLSF
jgi:adenine phosphoribosyltransferase